MKLYLAFLIILSIFMAPTVHAEYYIGHEFRPAIVSIHCGKCGCYWRIHNQQQEQHISSRARHYYKKHCDQDLATGDDDQCMHPDLQIN